MMKDPSVLFKFTKQKDDYHDDNDNDTHDDDDDDVYDYIRRKHTTYWMLM